MRALGGERIDRGRRLARVDGAAHQGQGARTVGMRVGAHQRGGGVAGDRRLTHRQDVQAGIAVLPDRLAEAHQVIDIVVEVERPFRQRHAARVAPVGDVDVRAPDHPLDGTAQQGREMAGHRRDDQELGATLYPLAAEPLELPERQPQHDLFGDRDFAPVDGRPLESERGLAARRGGMREHLQRGPHHRAAAEIGKRVCRVVEQPRAPARHRARAREHRSLHLVKVVKHDVCSNSDRFPAR